MNMRLPWSEPYRRPRTRQSGPNRFIEWDMYHTAAKPFPNGAATLEQRKRFRRSRQLTHTSSPSCLALHGELDISATGIQYECPKPPVAMTCPK